jgi:hypothetical protein
MSAFAHYTAAATFSWPWRVLRAAIACASSPSGSTAILAQAVVCGPNGEGYWAPSKMDVIKLAVTPVLPARR